MLAITKTTSDPAGAVIIKSFKATSDIQDSFARVSKSKTLDGGVVVIHSGYADGDRFIAVNTKLSETLSDRLWSMFKSETFVNLAIVDGVFSAAISRLKIDNGNIKMNLEIESKLST